MQRRRVTCCSAHLHFPGWPHGSVDCFRDYDVGFFTSSLASYLFLFIATSKVLHRAVDITRSSSLPTSTCTCLWGYGRHARLVLPLQRNSHPTIAPVRTQHATFTGTYTYALKSRSGLPRCDLAPLTTSYGTVGQWERQHRATAGSRHLHLPRNATAHCAARANPHCSVLLAEVDVRTCPTADNGYSYSVHQVHPGGYEGCVSLVLLRGLVAWCSFARLPRSLVVMFLQRVLTIDDES